MLKFINSNYYIVFNYRSAAVPTDALHLTIGTGSKANIKKLVKVEKKNLLV